MSSSSPPTKPPRGVKSRETSGLLLTVIRTLSTSESNEQREHEKAKLEREYKRSDQQLNELVSKHKQELTHVMQLFGKVSNNITTTRDKLRGMKEILIACKTLLSCRREELKKLWLEGVEHKHILKLLDEIEQIKDVPSKLSTHLANREYLDAAKLLVSALSVGDGALEGVEALRELKTELHHKRERLFLLTLREISRIVFIEPSKLNASFRDSGSFRGKSKWSRRLLESSQNKGPISGDGAIEPVFMKELTDLTECLALLRKLPDAATNIKSNLQHDVMGVVDRVTKAVVTTDSSNVHPFQDLLETLLELMRKVTHRFNFLAKAFNSACAKHEVTCSLQPSDIWNSVQAVLQSLLTDYLDIQNTSNEPRQTMMPFQDRVEDISLFFSRRRIQRNRDTALFKFEQSSIFTSHMGDQGVPSLSLSFAGDQRRDKIFVCSPDPNNITVIISPLIKFIEEIESISGVACTLNTFINDYIKNVFLSREYTRLKMAIEGATKLNDAWRTPTSPQVTADLNLGRPLLKSTVQVSDAVQDLEALLDSLPCHKSDVLDILIKLIRSYAETCGAAYRGIVHPGSEDKTLCSVSWLKDEDISRFLKSLPNWLNLQAQKPLLRNNRTLRREDTGEEESPEEIRQRNIKEAEILVGNLAEGGQLEIISDLQQLKSLGLLQESMEWFAWRMLQIANKSKKVVSTNDTNANLLADYAKSMNEISVEFEELANTCLLMLHLEVRVQCFHYLLPKNNNYGKSNKSTSQDPDPRVLELSRVLISIDEALSSSLQTRKIKYIFEGLGYLISKILMSTIRQMYKVDDLLIHKMCRNIFTLQQTLTNITMARDLSLDHARNYFQLFFLSPEEIMNEILEKRPDYSKAEITTVFMLISRSRGASEDIQKYVQRLTDVFGSAEFTV
ncbi:exocyst complex component [Nesidiocoris tenuis]|uniref:Exocyst complex component Sec8 n=1 Tax=Nesidiocoris tenuis TaxID=355587 RepID=A0ABN7AKS7_9HEMI|nr:exocyst complex component [Nesidiocoris tenuis]